jgi:hypothetical protein
VSCEAFVEKKFQAKTLALIGTMNAIVADYLDRGFVLTLRQLYYQLVARAIVENLQSEYKRVGSIVNDARLAGLMDWGGIEDRTRHLRRLPWWASPGDVIDAAAHAYREDVWRDQAARVEVWIEKDALLGVIEGVCEEFRVPYFACRGNNSQSEQYRAGQRLRDHFAAGCTPLILHLGDHDPNGLDMTRDNRDRLSMFTGRPVEVRRIALNMDQVERYGPPPNFAKETDSRFASYVRQYGENCWELDALDPDVIATLIRREIEGLLDRTAWNAALAEEQHRRDLLITTSQNWPMVESYVEAWR